jgi:aryl-alcohol dehydrogenase-like predicted oxidoreductase
MTPRAHIPFDSTRTVSRIGLGGGRFCGTDAFGPPARPDRCGETIRAALDDGVSLIDTADSYGPGWSETVIGRALRGTRPRPVVATKVGMRRDATGNWIVDADPVRLRAAAEQSLRRLGVEVIDLLQLHTPSTRVPLEDSLGALHDLRTAGLVRHVGVCNASASQLRLAITTGPIRTVQNQLNLASLTAADLETLALCESEGIHYLAYQPLADGLLLTDERIRSIATELSVPAVQLLLRVLLRLSESVVAIPGTCDPAHARVNAAALDADLDGRDLQIAERLVERARRRETTTESAAHATS